MGWDEGWVGITGRWERAGGRDVLDGGPSPGPSPGLVLLSLAVTGSDPFSVPSQKGVSHSHG